MFYRANQVVLVTQTVALNVSNVIIMPANSSEIVVLDGLDYSGVVLAIDGGVSGVVVREVSVIRAAVGLEVRNAENVEVVGVQFSGNLQGMLVCVC